MKLQLLLILSLVVVAVPLAFADHPDPVVLTLNQESFEFGDTLIVEAQLPYPWWSESNSPETKIYLRVFDEKMLFYKDFSSESTTGLDNNTGIITFTIPLTFIDLEKGVYTLDSFFETYVSSYEEDNISSGIEHYTAEYYIFTLNSNLSSQVVDYGIVKEYLIDEIEFLQSEITQLSTQIAQDSDYLKSLDSRFTEYSLILQEVISQFLETSDLHSSEIQQLQNTNQQILEELNKINGFTLESE